MISFPMRSAGWLGRDYHGFAEISVVLDSEMLHFSYGFGGKKLMTITKESKMFKGVSIGFELWI